MQPARCAGALGVLATIELEFALLREKLYVETMEAIAFEEALVEAEGQMARISLLMSYM